MLDAIHLQEGELANVNHSAPLLRASNHINTMTDADPNCNAVAVYLPVANPT